MAPPVLNQDFYAKDDFQFSSVQFPKDEYVQAEENRVLAKFIPKAQAINFQDHYSKVYMFILRNIIPNHDELVSCDLAHEDMEGNPDIIFNIKFDEGLSFSKRSALHCTILEEICDFCVSSDFSYVFDDITVLLVRGR